MDRSLLLTEPIIYFKINTSSPPEIYTEKARYPQLSTPFPHLGVKVAKRTSLKESLKMRGRGLVRALLLNLGGDLINMVIESATLSHQLTDLTIGMHHRRVVASAEGLADLR